MNDCIEHVPWSWLDEDEEDNREIESSTGEVVDANDPRLHEVQETNSDLVPFGFGGRLRVILGMDGFVSIAIE